MSGKEPILDTRTRWNSTHAMIERACELRAPLSNMASAHPDLPSLSDAEWELLEVVGQVLSVFRKPVQPLFGDKYPTLNEVVPIYNYLFDMLEDFLDPCDDKAHGQGHASILDRCSPASKHALTDAIKAAHDKIHKYYAQLWAAMDAITVILDPRLKMDYYKHSSWEPDLVAHAKNAMQRATKAYGAVAPQADVAEDSDRMDEWPYIKRQRIDHESDLDKYLAVPAVKGGKDALEWWKHHHDEYPGLARIARDYLAIPATSVPSERVFSSGANLISDKRGSLNDDSIQACLCLGSWLR
jgi:hAT family protein